MKGIFGLQRFLWSLASVLLPERDGLLVHAASVCDERGAFIFPAPSGTGKSTLIRNSPQMRVLSDEGTLIRFRDGGLWAYGSPFRSDQFRDFAYGMAPVAGIYFLRQAPIDQLDSLPPAEALERLITETFLYADDPASRLAVFRMADRTVRSTPTGILQLQNAATFWRCLDRAKPDDGAPGVPPPGR